MLHIGTTWPADLKIRQALPPDTSLSWPLTRAITQFAITMDFRQFTISTSGTIGVVALVWYLSRRNGPPQAETSMQLTEHRVRCSDSAICAQILACEGYNSTGARNLYTDLKSRAIPNERLTSAFGIDNSFTTSEVERRKKFNAEAGKKIKMTDAKVGNPSERKLSTFSKASSSESKTPIPFNFPSNYS